MILGILQQFIRFLLLTAIQVVILNNVQLGTFINPFLYVLFLLTLPVNMPRLAL